jgi:hypothetical protein
VEELEEREEDVEAVADPDEVADAVPDVDDAPVEVAEEPAAEPELDSVIS